jgi:D-3-phosphoglycerate dehydrogenase/C-terminal binding protein
MATRFKIAVTDFIIDSLEPEKQILGDLGDVFACDAYDERQLWGKIEDVDAIMIYHNISITRATIERLTRCKLIVRCGVGFDNVDRAFARERGIPVCNVPDYGTEEVADSAIGMMLAMTRGISVLDSRLKRRAGEWRYTEVAPLRRLRGRVFGIIGLGRIGTAAATRAKAIGMEVAFLDPYKLDGYDKALGVRRVETFDELLRQAHVLSIHCPLTPETGHLIDAVAMAKMPPGSYLVNTARGAIVKTSDVPQAIASGQLAGAAIDVLEHEPAADDDPLVVAWRDPKHPAHDRVIVNPHAAFYSEEGLMDMRTKGSDACRRALLGMPLRNVVN